MVGRVWMRVVAMVVVRFKCNNMALGVFMGISLGVGYIFTGLAYRNAQACAMEGGPAYRKSGLYFVIACY